MLFKSSLLEEPTIRSRVSRGFHFLAARAFTRQTLSLCVATLIAVGLSMAVASEACAQKYKVDEEVEAFFLNKWWPGVVVEVNRRGDAKVEYEFANRTQTRLFTKSNLRRLYESGALARGRFWSDPSGKFKVRAALLAIDGDSLTLRKEDLAEIKVELSKLSTADKTFIRKYKKDAGPAAEKGPPPPAVEQFAQNKAFSFGAVGRGASGRVAIEADPTPGYLKLVEGGVGFSAENFHDRIGAVLPVGGPDSWLLTAIENHSPGGALPTKILWASLEKQKIEHRQLLPPGEVVLDYHPPSHRLLTFTNLEREENAWGISVLTLWEVVPSDEKVTPIVRWEADSGDRLANPWARLIDGKTVVQRWKRQEYVVWNIERKRMQYRISQESFFAPSPTLSGGRKYIFMPEDKQVRIIEASSGRVVSTLPATDGAAAVGISEDGRRAAVLGRSTLLVWDLTDASVEPKSYQAEAIGTPFTAKLRWVSDQRVMSYSGTFGNMVLFSLKHKLALWNYSFDHNAIRENSERRVRDIVNEHLVYASSIRGRGQSGLAVGAVSLPGPVVNQKADALDPESLMILKPGSSVRIEVKAGEHNDRVYQSLVKNVEANGWKLSSNATNVIAAEMSRGKTQQPVYRNRETGTTQTVTITPYISSLKIMVAGKIAWQSGTSSGVPPMVNLSSGTSIQAEVNRWQRPNVEFFDQAKMPARISDPAKRNGLGSTEVTNRGLVVKQ